MYLQIFWIFILTLSTVLLHGSYNVWLLFRLYKHKQRSSDKKHPKRYFLLLLSEVVGLLLFLHSMESSVWALYYLVAGGLPDFETSLYFSLASYTTIGYGDVVLPVHMRLVGAAEGMVGTFLSGWSVAVFVAVMGYVTQTVFHAPERR